MEGFNKSENNKENKQEQEIVDKEEYYSILEKYGFKRGTEGYIEKNRKPIHQLTQEELADAKRKFPEEVEALESESEKKPSELSILQNYFYFDNNGKVVGYEDVGNAITTLVMCDNGGNEQVYNYDSDLFR